MTSISPVSNSVVNFKSNKQYEAPVLYKTYKTEATTGKKWGVGIASWILPGSGQAINNEWGKGLGFFALSAIAPPVIGAMTGLGMGLTNFTKGTKATTAVGIIGLGSILLAGIGGRIWACIDAVKNAKSEIEVPVKG